MAGMFRFRQGVLALLWIAIAFLSVGGARAQVILRDPEIEYALDQLAAPIIQASGLSASRVKILVIKDNSLNAFVADSTHIFIHSGLMLKMKTRAELQSVIAHEVAHIANGHISRRLSNQQSAGTAAKLGMLLAIGVAASGGPVDAAAGVMIGTSSSATRVFLSHTRAEEAAADQSAVRYMASVGVAPRAMLDVLDLFRGQEVLSEGRQDPYARSHPMTRDRIRRLEGFTAAYKDINNPNATADYWFARGQGKLSAFLRNPSWTLGRVKKGDTSDVALIRRAVAYHRIPKPAAAMKEINALAVRRPKDPFVFELKGQIELESRNFAAAARSYQRAVSLAPKNALILGGYGHALLVAGNPRAALKVLEKARARDFRDPRLLRDLASAYAQTGNNGMASLSTAERYAVSGKLKDAAIHGKRAMGLLPRGSPGWRRAEDIVYAADQVKGKK